MEHLPEKIKSCAFVPPTGSRILAAVSGGADSTAMLLALNQLKGEMNWQLSVAHVDHGLRPQAGEDAGFVAELAARLGLAFCWQRVQINKKGLAPEEAARQARRQALLAMAGQEQAQYIALAHHADDQAETLLMRFISGTGPSGLAGMRVFSAPWWRPLLDVPGQSLRRFLQQQNQPWREDHTNAQNVFTRNRIRHELLPLLREKFNPRVVAALGRLAQICAEEERFWQNWGQDQNCLYPDGQDWLIKLKPEWLPAQKRRFLRFALAKVYGKGQHVLALHIEQLLALAEKQTGKQTPLPGNWLAWREGEFLALSKNEPMNWPELLLHGPASFYWQGAWYSMELNADSKGFSARGETAWLPYAAINWPVFLRQPMEGERFHAYNGVGSRKIRHLLQDMGIPRRRRGQVLLLCDQSGPWWLGPVMLHQRVADSGSAGQWLKVFAVKKDESR